jgi:DNA-binding PadR family transcriptional regulator
MTKRTDAVRAQLPLTPVAFEILLSLAGQDRHGYHIMHAVEQRTDGRITLHPGTLYRAIARLLDEQLIEELDERPDPSGDERRRYYRLTAFGRDVAEAEAERLESQVQAARSLRLLRKSGRP